MRNSVFVAVVAVSLAGCAQGGTDRARPDEFAVARQAPLVIPPDFSLVPPAPGAARPQDSATTAQTLEALFGANQARSAGERGALTQAGSGSADPGIRSAVGDPGTTIVDKGATTRDIVAAPEGDGQDARAATNVPAAAPAPVATPTPNTPATATTPR